MLLEDQDSSKQLSATVGQMKNALSESYNVSYYSNHDLGGGGGRKTHNLFYMKMYDFLRCTLHHCTVRT